MPNIGGISVSVSNAANPVVTFTGLPASMAQPLLTAQQHQPPRRHGACVVPTAIGAHQPNTYTGDTFVNNGTVILQGNSNLGGPGTLTTGFLRFTGGTITTAGSTAITLDNSLQINGSVTFAAIAAAPITLNGPVSEFTKINALTVNTSPLTFLGPISSQAVLMAGGNNTLQLFGNSASHSAGIILAGGTINVGIGGTNIFPLGTGALTFAGGSLTTNYSKLNIGNPVNIPNTTATITGSTSLTLSGTINLVGAATIAATNTGVTTCCPASTTFPAQGASTHGRQLRCQRPGLLRRQ